MSGQMALPLGWQAARTQATFLVSPANADAVRYLDAWATWPLPVALLVGPAGSGKSHLAAIFARRANARLWDDADRSGSDEALFHAWNDAVADRRPLLLTARSAPADWHLALPDLRSRLAATPLVRIHPPDDALLAGLFEKLFRDRGIEVPPELTHYVTTRIERSFEAVARAVAALDAASLAGQRPLTIPLARTVLVEAGL
ncbi:HdaA/DnaA family protein [Sandaracinobacteroides saxicola]|uniref:Chromosomal replication initiator DnaA n=1 Tax=Sandaracinobacteroides saxicola TaxID=2759707 RepID=A0A7G5IHS3_9SPHN|nr:DnaA/Hda family protein [Sandaracinobacteroides saxicola]QMW22915.1 chromosomal replication initiator DnaA [Sandaracinobacteroides saxicola]